MEFYSDLKADTRVPKNLASFSMRGVLKKEALTPFFNILFPYIQYIQYLMYCSILCLKGEKQKIL